MNSGLGNAIPVIRPTFIPEIYHLAVFRRIQIGSRLVEKRHCLPTVLFKGLRIQDLWMMFPL